MVIADSTKCQAKKGLYEVIHGDIILTAHGTIESAVEAMKQGAYSYVTKPFDARDLLLQIEKAMENWRLAWEIRRLKKLSARP